MNFLEIANAIFFDFSQELFENCKIARKSKIETPSTIVQASADFADFAVFKQLLSVSVSLR
jgi:hypothetical protein